MNIEVTREISTAKGKESRKVAVLVPIPTSLPELINTYGEEVCVDALTAVARVSATEEISRVMQGGTRGARRMSDEQIQAHMNQWKMGVDYAERDRNLLNISKLTDPNIQNAALAALGATREDMDLFLSLRAPAPAPEPIPEPVPVEPMTEPAPTEEAPKKRSRKDETNP